MIYLDNAATTYPKPEAVYLEMDRVNRFLAVNAGRGSYKRARDASKLIVDTKERLRELVHADMSTSIVFSPSVTIAMNQIVHGLNLRENAIVYVSPYEHNAVARTIHQLSKNKKIFIKELPINAETLAIDIERTRYEFSKDKPSAIFCTHVSNVTGYILPVEEVFEEGKRYNSINVLDAAQSIGLLPMNVALLKADFIAFAGHKTLYGPFGIGGFINVAGIKLSEFITGGTGSDSLNLNMPHDNESKYEPSSMNIVAVAGLNAALKKLNQSEIWEHETELTHYLIERLRQIRGIHMYLPVEKNKHIGILSFVVKDMRSDEVGMILDEDFDIAVRTGYHCAPFIHKYLKDKNSSGTVRIGLSQFSTIEDIDALVSALKQLEE